MAYNDHDPAKLLFCCGILRLRHLFFIAVLMVAGACAPHRKVSPAHTSAGHCGVEEEGVFTPGAVELAHELLPMLLSAESFEDMEDVLETILSAVTSQSSALQLSAMHQRNLVANADIAAWIAPEHNDIAHILTLADLVSDWGKSPPMQEVFLTGENNYSKLLIYTLMGKETEVHLPSDPSSSSAVNLNNSTAIAELRALIDDAHEGGTGNGRFPLQYATKDYTRLPPEVSEEHYRAYLRLFSDEKKLRGFFHDLPGMFLPVLIRAFHLERADGFPALQAIDARHLMSAIWNHNGPQVPNSYWDQISREIAYQPLEHSAYYEGELRLRYPDPPDIYAYLATLFDRYDQAMETGIFKIIEEIWESNPLLSLHGIFNSAVRKNFEWTLNQVEGLREQTRGQSFTAYPALPGAVGCVDARIRALQHTMLSAKLQQAVLGDANAWGALPTSSPEGHIRDLLEPLREAFSREQQQLGALLKQQLRTEEAIRGRVRDLNPQWSITEEAGLTDENGRELSDEEVGAPNTSLRILISGVFSSPGFCQDVLAQLSKGT